MQKNLDELCIEIRKELLHLHYEKQLPHIGSELSCIEILVGLHFRVMKNEDTFILSKSHAAPALYAIQHIKDIISDTDYSTVGNKFGSRLAEHVSYPENDYKGGSLGHGLPFAVGLALGKKLDSKEDRIFCLLSDGELQEGSTYEAMNFASRYDLHNLIAIVDCNQWQAYDKTDDILQIDKVQSYFSTAGWDTFVVYGHNLNEISDRLSMEHSHKPKIIFCDTLIGKGIKSFEGKLESHYYPPKEEQVKKGIK